jgi:lysozyme
MAVNNVESQLRRDEGERLTVYKDSKGYWTLGIGILVDERKGGGITKEESSYLFNNRLARIKAELRRRYKGFDLLDEVRQGVLLNMSYQMGIDGLLAFKRMFAAIAAADWRKASVEMLDSKWAREDSPARAERLARQMILGVWQ